MSVPSVAKVGRAFSPPVAKLANGSSPPFGAQATSPPLRKGGSGGSDELISRPETPRLSERRAASKPERATPSPSAAPPFAFDTPLTSPPLSKGGQGGSG